MGKSLVQKILETHLISGKLQKGEEIAVRVDQTLLQDATGTMACLEFESMGFKEVKTFALAYIDHNTVQVGFENMDDHKYLQSIAEKFGIILSKPGNGICHQVHLERFAKPGTLLLGSDSHTPTAGGIGALAIGSGGLDVAVAMGGGPFYLTYPKVIRVELKGELPPWVSAKDVILKVLSILTSKGNVGCILEYGGEGVKSLSVPDRATIANMGAETGVTTSIFPSDEITLEFLRKQGREKDWIPLEADEDAEYDQIIEIDLSKLEPLIACPHSPDNVKPVRDIEGIKVDQVAIGSCTNSSYRDLMTVAHILKGRRVHKDVQLGITPGSRQVLLTIDRDGGLADILRAGARLLELTCNFCIGNCFAPNSKGVSVRTSNRNFKGRSGTPDALVYLASPETAAATALTGKITDPRRLEDMGIEFKRFSLPESFVIDDSGFVFPPPKEEREKIEIYRGPNIKPVPIKEALKESIKGVITIKVGDKITTDHITPAGAYLKLRSNVPEYAKHVFEPVDPTFYERALKNKEMGLANIILAGESYGQGSSREHAAICPMYLGVEAVIAKSIERIHFSNLVNFGIVPLTFANPDDYNELSEGDEVILPNIKRDIEEGKEVTKLVRVKDGKEFTLKVNLSERQRKMVLAGGVLPLISKGGA
ncbi:MAG: aconitate hydratase [Synergistetes bacterium]|nr:aconitate hydratase [Synergistota bacterium]